MRSPKRRSRGRPQAGAGSLPLYKRSLSHFEPAERHTGAERFQEGRVSLEIDGARARAVVAGVNGEELDFFRVGVDWSRVANRRVHTFCECRRFVDGQLCAHIWAVLLALGETGPEHQPVGKDRLGLRKDRGAAWQDLADFTGGAPVFPAADGGDSASSAGVAPRPRPLGARSTSRRTRAGTTSWRSRLASLGDELVAMAQPTIAPAKAAKNRSTVTLQLAVNPPASIEASGLVLDVFGRSIGASGKPGKLKRMAIEHRRLEEMLLDRGPNGGSGAGPEDSAISVALVTELPTAVPRRKKTGRRQAKAPVGIRRMRLPPELYETSLPQLAKQRVLGWWDGRALSSLKPLRWDSAGTWRLALHLEVDAGGAARLRGVLERGKDSVPLDEPALILPPGPDAAAGASGLVVFTDSIGRLEIDRRRDLPWISLLRSGGDVVVPQKEVRQALSEVMDLPALPRLEVPPELGLTEELSTPSPRIGFDPGSTSAYLSNPPFLAELAFDYGAVRVGAEDPRSSVVDWDAQTLLRRDLDQEHAALVRLLELGARPVAVAGSGVQALEVEPAQLPAVIEPLLAEGWAVQIEGRSVRPPSPPNLRIESGIDWFDLSGEVEFEGDRLELDQVLAAASSGSPFVELEDGSRGLLPAAWMETYDSLGKLARESSEEGLRFLSSQALIVDALLAALPPTDVDAAFAKLRTKLQAFDRIKPIKEPRGFRGELRAYQRQGLGWLDFLREFGLGGVLADDMGLGKTVQVLALMVKHRTPSKTTKLPFLVVAPRSVVYNWIDEASRFAPKLKTLEYRGPGREALRAKLGKHDLVVTTYGTLRRDISYLSGVELDTVILDEAQAIKNPSSQTAKASRLLTARHRLALTGTPIENHLGELGSIFEFLNPDLLGRLPRLEVLTAARTPSKRELEQLAEDLKPFILRRTKEQVLPDLPPKTEQVLLSEMGDEQREIYDRVRLRYQASLMEEVEKKGVGGSAIQVLEALLRLRQVACHPALVDPEWEDAGSSKVDTLLEQVTEVLDEGHKALVFSQFTTLLGLVEKRLEAQGIQYAYLDGKTRNRGEVVERFQTDPSCNLFLISLKAGGVGLNLTAAGYVFLLDPWWNPAVEAQAIDRTHRIGQNKPVFAYRMIAKDTVEEKLLELQTAKRDLAEAILDGEGQSVKDLTADDLRVLLS